MFGYLAKRVLLIRKCAKIMEFEGELTVERTFICDVVHQQNTHRSTVVGCGYGPESLLASRIPLEEDVSTCMTSKSNCNNALSAA